MKAIMWNNYDNVVALLALGASIGYLNYDGRWDKRIDVLINDLKILELFLNRGIDHDRGNTTGSK